MNVGIEPTTLKCSGEEGIERMTQGEALALLKTGASIFLTGQPGSGKTHTVNRYIDSLRRTGVGVAFTASTGIAATHGSGITIHAWSGIGVRHALTRRDPCQCLHESRGRNEQDALLEEVALVHRVISGACG